MSYVEVLNHPSGIKYLSKRTVCSFLNQKERVSRDRLRRFHVRKTPSETENADQTELLVQKMSIHIGDVVLVHEDENYYVGQVLGFQFMDVRYKKEKRFLSDTFNFPKEDSNNTKEIGKANKKRVGMLASWFLVGDTDDLSILSEKELFDVESYVGHVRPESIDMVNLKFKND